MKHNNLKYVKVYTGVVTGSRAGRDDGHPIQDCKLYKSVTNVSDTKEQDEVWYRLEPMTPEDVDRLKRMAHGKRAAAKKRAERQIDEIEYERLKKKLGK